jgi:hypothetical protein
MAQNNLERAARMRAIAAEFRAYAAETEWPLYRIRMSETADALERDAAKLDRYRLFSLAS